MPKVIQFFLAATFFCTRLLAADTSYYKHIDERLLALKQNVLKDILSENVAEAKTVELADKMKPDGSWPDIDYTDKTRGGWPVADHLTRLNNMAILYTRTGSKLKGDEQLEKKIIGG